MSPAPDARPGEGARGRLLFIVNEARYFLSHRLDLALAARADGWEVEVASAPGAGQEGIRAAGLTVHGLPLSRSGANPLRELRAVLAARRLLRERRPDLVHCVALKAIVIGGLAARLTGTAGRVLAIAGLGHTFIERGPAQILLRALFRGLLPWLAGKGGRLIVQNDEDLDTLGVPLDLRRRSVLIRGSGVNLERFAPAPEPAGPATVLVAGRMLRTKGIGEVVEAARRLKARGIAVRVLLAGDSDRGNAAAIAPETLAAWQSEGLVEWLGHRADMPDLLAGSHIACLPSYREGLPKSLIEAAAAGRPIVTSDVTGCRDVVRDGDNGLLVPARDAEALAGALRRLIDDPARRRRMGARGREIAEEAFGLNGVIDRTLQVYREAGQVYREGES